MSVYHVYAVPVEPRRKHHIPESGVTGTFELPCGFWEPNAGPSRCLFTPICPYYYVSSGHPNSDFHAYTANVLPTQQSLRSKELL